MNPDPLAVRVAHRDAAVVLGDVPVQKTLRVDYACDGTISSFWLRMALEPGVGYVRKLRFLSPTQGPSTTVAWEAVTGTGERVTGSLVLRTTVTADGVATWAEVTVDAVPSPDLVPEPAQLGAVSP